MRAVAASALLLLMLAAPAAGRQLRGDGAANATAAVAAPAVVGGRPAPQNRLRHQLGFMAPNGGICGASLIRDDVALTAAHCIGSFRPKMKELTVVAGARGPFWRAAEGYGGGTPYAAKRVVVHPDYAGFTNPESHANDLALVFLDQCVARGPAVAPAQLATREDYQAALNSTWMVSGWGTTSEGADRSGTGGAMPSTLQFGAVRSIDADTCAAQAPIVKDRMLCAGGVPAADGGAALQDACHGDSGGPATLNLGSADRPEDGDPSEDRVVGIVSFGYGCGVKDNPGVYTSVPYYRDWIVAMMDAVKRPCAAGGAIAPVQASGSRNWGRQPDKSIRLKPSEGVDKCLQECRKRATSPKKSPKGCAAFGVSVKAPAPAAGSGGSANSTGSGSGSGSGRARSPAKFCDLYYEVVPGRVCGDGESDGLCARPSEGSFRMVYN